MKTEEDLSAYIAYHSNISRNLALLSGFVFTAIVLLINLLPNPSQPLVQLAFFVLSAVFNLMVFQLFGEEELLGYCVKIAPKLPKGYPTRTINFLSPLSWALLGMAIVILFLVLELYYLALASTVMTVISDLVGYFKIGKPLQRWQKWKRVSLFEDESTD